MRYIGFFPDSTIIKKDSLSELQNVGHIKYILTEELKDNKWPNYSLINIDGSPRSLIVGKYEVVDIEYADKKWHNGRIATIIETDTKKTHRISFREKWHDFLTIELIPFLKELNAIGNLDLYLNIRRSKSISEDVSQCIDTLLQIISEKNRQIEVLKKEKPSS